MQEATQTTAASAEESAAAGAELSAQSESMRQTVRGLAQMVGGQAGL
jgi:methyl-accepting chemotaxis protein